MSFLYPPFQAIMHAIHTFVPSYGWTVVLFTLLIRIILLPLDIKSKKSMQKMAALNPQLEAIKKKYSKDQEKLTQKQQELYRKNKVNPLSGCLPMLISLPLLFAMVGVLREMANEQTVKMLLDMSELAGASPVDYAHVPMQGWLWIKNVWQPDSFTATILPMVQGVEQMLSHLNPVAGNEILTAENIDAVKTFVLSPQYEAFLEYFGATTVQMVIPVMGIWNFTIPGSFNGLFLLPIIAAGTQLLSSKLIPGMGGGADANAAGKSGSSGSTNKMMMYLFPIMSIFICATTNAAFSIYWVAANVIQIVQQLALNFWFDKKAAKEKAGKPEEAL